MLMEMLYSIVFFLLPVVGMFLAIIFRGVQLEKEGKREVTPLIKRRKARPVQVSPLVDHPVMRYQLIESRVQMPLRWSHHKPLFHQRAGP